MSIRVDSSSLITGAVVVGDPGLGVLAEAVPSTGEHGAGYLYASLEFPADTGKEVRGLITTWPTLGTLTAFEDSSFEYDGASDTFAFQMYVDGVAVGTPQTVTVTVVAGATYNEAHAAAVTPADSFASAAIFSATLAETTTPSDATAAATAFAVSLAEAVTLLDASSNGSLYTEVLTASVALSDALANTVTLTGAVTESTALTDALNALATFQVTLSEAVAAGDFVATQADQATLPRKVLTARITALSFAARVEADAFGARVSAPALQARNDT